jgi:hypothetical protein
MSVGMTFVLYGCEIYLIVKKNVNYKCHTEENEGLKEVDSSGTLCLYLPPDIEIEVALSWICRLMVKFVNVMMYDYLIYRCTI